MIARRSAALKPILMLLAGLSLGACDDDAALDEVPRPEPSALRIEKAFPALSFEQPLFLTQAPGDAGRVFVVTKPGLIQVFPKVPNAENNKVFLDLRSVVTDEGEQGLLGLAFDPDYAANGHFYVYLTPAFTDSSQHRVEIRRYTVSADPDVADAGSGVTVLTAAQPAFTNHKGGWIGFGPDQKLYVATGDGGGGGDPQNNAQNLNVLLGKILRINRDGSVPDDNPYANQAGRRGEIWAFGLRNPFRASFDRRGGRLWAGDVGQGLWEEIDLVERGGNYGWRRFEGNHVFNTSDPDPENARPPEWEYGHDSGRCSITGGYVYRGAALRGFDGVYLYADLCTGELWGLGRSGDAYTSTALGAIPGSVTSFGEDADGEIYATSFDGNIYKLVPAAN